jgi:hypothetical protein
VGPWKICTAWIKNTHIRHSMSVLRGKPDYLEPLCLIWEARKKEKNKVIDVENEENEMSILSNLTNCTRNELISTLHKANILHTTRSTPQCNCKSRSKVSYEEEKSYSGGNPKSSSCPHSGSESVDRAVTSK